MKVWQKIYDQGREPPAVFFQQPDVWPHLARHWIAFHDLSSERQIGMGLGPIPHSKIKDYVRDEIELDGEAADRFVGIIRQMDAEYLDASNPSPKGKDKSGEVAMDDVEGVKNIFDRIATRQKEAKTKKQ